MAERDPNSLLIQLKQLQKIEQDRIDSERSAKEQAAEARRQAAIGAQRVAEQARKREEAEQLEGMRQQQLRRQQQLEDQQRRVTAAEKQARAAAEARLLAHRHDVHTHALQYHKAHRWKGLLSGILVLVLLTCAGLGYAIYQSKEEIAQAEATRKKQDQLFAELKQEFRESQLRAKEEGDRAKAEVAELTKKIAATRDKAQKKLWEEERRRKKEAEKLARELAEKRRRDQERRNKTDIGKIKANDLLDGILQKPRP